MPRVTRVAPHLTLDEVKQKVHAAKATWLRERWLIIQTALLDPRPAAAIARQLGVSQALVAKVASLYKRFGPQGLETVGPGGRRNAYLTSSEEADFLKPFFERAAHGELVTTAAIQQAFAERVQQAVDSSTIYRLLERHQWRKIVPRSYHPQSDPEAQTAFKKTSPRSLTRRSQPKPPMINAQS